MAPLRRYLVAAHVALAACGYPELSAPGVEFLSCAKLAPTCGLAGNDSCCTSPEVPGGSYVRSQDVAMDNVVTEMSAPASVSGFRLDKYEVTVGRFREFVEAGMGTRASAPPAGAGAHAGIPSGWDASWDANLAETTDALIAALKCDPGAVRPDPDYWTWTDLPAANEHRPMNCVTWYEAMAFCIWDGGYLPTEAEWNYAAAGGDQQRAYPWSSPAGSTDIDGSHLSYKEAAGDDVGCFGDGVTKCNSNDLLEVGSKPAGDGRWNQSDLAGNVWEWTLDGYSDSYQTPCIDCAELAATANRVSRGGSYASTSEFVRTAHHRNSGSAPTLRSHTHGLRCARPAQARAAIPRARPQLVPPPR